jgi:CcmD family protein
MSAAEKYVAAAYLVVFAIVLVYLAIIAAKVARLERELHELARLARRREPAQEDVEALPEELPVA